MSAKPQNGPPQAPNEEAVKLRKTAIALTELIKSQKDIKIKPAVLNGKRTTYFRVKRALRYLMSDAYDKKRGKDLPVVKNREEAVNVLKLLIMNSMIVRVEKLPAKHKKQPLVELQINRNQDFQDDMHYVILYERLQKRAVFGALALVLIVLALIFYPLWPTSMRKGAYYMSMVAIGFILSFVGLVIVRFILFCISCVIVSPGIWLFPNLLADVGFVDSFKPLWCWNEKPGKKSKKHAKAKKSVKPSDTKIEASESVSTAIPTPAQPKYRGPTIEEVEEE
ncbi:ER protein translocation subcomplex subunit Sec62 [Schizosaccharomyces japonicus yFS275]|uniref:Translocation protein SEC62 n=1 Tax=Schizosaccharomyces japonicus (strain yFS275 / FY16936) TaxID=402676 RepID=B6K0N0_SCHJY|nr:ER protein translocation subcomplex subunit Sec62 [Schizosaccharomyces japonicus yFS275]EEB07501.1 ER protein translocation subcomplex subunit Sec62 [Schizosaccharomyces japonicus yFS275]